MSYEQLAEYDPVARAEAVPFSRPLLSKENFADRLPGRNAILSRLDDVKKYIRTDSSHTKKGIQQKVRIDGSASLYENAGAEAKGEPHTTVAYGVGTSLQLEGRTDATFDGGSFNVASLKMKDSDECTCTEDKCVTATGVIKAKYSVKTRVSLPSVSQYPELTPAQKRRLQNDITNVLAPHEQKHVAAFNKYRGATSTPFNLSLCRSEFDGTIQSMFEAQEASRRQAAQAESDSLDPFFFEFEL